MYYYDDRSADVLASAIARRLASAQHVSASRVSVSALASAVARRLASQQRYSASRSHVSALASAVARRLASGHHISALASAVARHLASQGVSASHVSASGAAAMFPGNMASRAAAVYPGNAASRAAAMFPGNMASRAAAVYPGNTASAQPARAAASPASASMLASAIARRIVQGTPQSQLASSIAAGGATEEVIADLVARHLASARAVVASSQGNFASALVGAVERQVAASGFTASSDQIERMADAIALAIQLTTGSEGSIPAEDTDVSKALEGSTTEEPAAGTNEKPATGATGKKEQKKPQ